MTGHFRIFKFASPDRFFVIQMSGELEETNPIAIRALKSSSAMLAPAELQRGMCC